GFTAPAKYATARAPRKILVGDFNTDGKLDMAVGADAGVSLLLGDGVGGFATVSAVPTGFATQSGLAAGDFNNDGKLDLAGVSNISDVVTIFLGDGAGHFSAPSTYAILSSGGIPSRILRPTFVAAADFNDDGRVDLIVAGAGAAV